MSSDSKRLAIVTGANRGIGHEIARQLVRRGMRVIGTSRDATAGRAAAKETGAESFELDVTADASMDALAAHVASGVDVLVNNAGTSMKGFDANVARSTVDTNFFGPMKLVDRILPLMRARGRIVNVSSALGELRILSPELRARFANPTLGRAELVALVESFVRAVAEGNHAKLGWPTTAYGVSKVALNALTRVLARELADDPRAILVNAVSPGWVRTRMGGVGAPRSVEQGAKTPVWLATTANESGKFFADERAIDW